MKGVVGPRGAGLELERRLPRMADGEPKSWCGAGIQGGHHSPFGWIWDTHMSIVRLQPCLIKWTEFKLRGLKMVEESAKKCTEYIHDISMGSHGITPKTKSNQYLPLCPVLNCWFSLSIPIRFEVLVDFLCTGLVGVGFSCKLKITHHLSNLRSLRISTPAVSNHPVVQPNFEATNMLNHKGHGPKSWPFLRL